MNKLGKIILLGVMSIVVTNCAVIAVGAVGAAAGTTAVVASDPRLSGTVVSDNTIATKLKVKYSDYDNANIYVNTYNGAVLLTGQIANAKMKESAEFEARVTPGVKRIYNYLQIRLPQSFASISTDSYTTTQVRAKILNIYGVKSNDIKVVTTDNVVYLFGVLTQVQARDVAEKAAHVNGVAKVITFFEYISTPK